jgi:quercetin dioxygenase-like cupin family protein
MDTAVILRRFDQPDETRQLILGRFDIVRIGGMTIGRATYQPGWRWSEHVGRALGQERCNVEHLGLVVSGIATAAFADGRVIELRAGELFYIPPAPHDSWVVGDEPYVSLHFMGAEKYAR